MNLLKKLTAPKEVKLILSLMDEANHKFDCPAFATVKRAVETSIYGSGEEIKKLVREGTMEPRQILYAAIANVSGDYVSSGQYHIYRGVLNTMGDGPDLLKIFDGAMDEIKNMGFIDGDQLKEQKSDLREQMKQVG